ncbi:MAG TPA: geranylgeranylglycerol-phosphate geranylgeranyltransferase [Cyclobacteriaceae bacterium]|nr:geranylgeranylglycerol-phosphate geranylgeranyltransferase [Cyclobacteriaceae bacterium]
MPKESYQPFTIRALLRLTRFWNLVIIGMSQYFAAIFLIDRELLFDWRLFLLASSTAIIAGAGYIINDYYDIKIDLINKPERVVIGKSITRRYALFFHSVLSLVGVALGFLLGWKVGAIHFLSVFLLWWYSNSLKRQPFIGNFVVAWLTSISIVLVNILYDLTNPLVVIYALFAFFMTLIREIVKDMEDLKGDNTFGCKTLPIIWGIRKTKWIIYVLLVLLGASVVLLNERYSQLPLSYFLIFLYIPLGLLLVRLFRADTRKDFYWLSQWCKIIMLFGVVSMVFI